ncbi:MAG: hypothetical protein WEA58_04125 [Balneolaceae bacterium]
MSAFIKTIKKVTAWHNVRNKLLLEEDLTKKERLMLIHALNQCEGVVFPYLREIESYKQNFTVMENTSAIKSPQTFKRSYEEVAAFEENYLPQLNKINRKVS